MIAVWPTELPQKFLRDGFTQGFRDGRLRTQMDSGPPKIRRRTRSATFPVTANFYATFAQVGRFRQFWEDDTGGGTLPFAGPDQLADGLLLADPDGNVLGDDFGNPLGNSAYWLANFGEQVPQVSMQSGQLCRISVSFAVLP